MNEASTPPIDETSGTARAPTPEPEGDRPEHRQSSSSSSSTSSPSTSSSILQRLQPEPPSLQQHWPRGPKAARTQSRTNISRNRDCETAHSRTRTTRAHHARNARAAHAACTRTCTSTCTARCSAAHHTRASMHTLAHARVHTKSTHARTHTHTQYSHTTLSQHSAGASKHRRRPEWENKVYSGEGNPDPRGKIPP